MLIQTAGIIGRGVLVSGRSAPHTLTIGDDLYACRNCTRIFDAGQNTKTNYFLSVVVVVVGDVVVVVKMCLHSTRRC